MKHTFLFFILLVFTVSCQDLKKTEKPEDLIPEAKMVDVLTELSLLHAARNFNKQKLEETGIKPEEYIYKRFNIDSLQFERSNNYYSEQYSQYERIYDSVKVRLQVIKSRLDALREIEVKIEDSIKQARKDSIKAADSLRVNPQISDSLKLKKLRSIKKRKRDSLITPPVMLKGDSSRKRS